MVIAKGELLAAAAASTLQIHPADQMLLFGLQEGADEMLAAEAWLLMIYFAEPPYSVGVSFAAV